MQKSASIWVNGRLVDWDDAKIHVLTHGLHYGTGVFEGIRCYETTKGTVIFRMQDHVKRLLNSAKIYMMEVPFGFDDICDAIIQTVKVNHLPDCYVRPIAFYGYGKMGVTPKNRVDLVIAVWKWDEYLEPDSNAGLKCLVSSWRRIDSKAMPLQAKATANYANSALVRLEAMKSGYDEGIMLNADGMVAESSAENIFIIKEDGVLVTPPTAAGALEGITRDSVLKIAKHKDIPSKITNIARDELYTAEEIFLTGTAAGIKPVTEIDRRKVGDGTVGPVTKKLQGLYNEIVRGNDGTFSKWLTFVK